MRHAIVRDSPLERRRDMGLHRDIRERFGTVLTSEGERHGRRFGAAPTGGDEKRGPVVASTGQATRSARAILQA